MAYRYMLQIRCNKAVASQLKAKTQETCNINSNVVQVNIEVALRWATEDMHDALLRSGVKLRNCLFLWQCIVKYMN